jgi:predicted regulator of Ras-like GTPase activity (Roadblock/LC7/MglB family)
MKNVLDPLARIPGVRLAALVSPDGVPIDVRSSAPMKNAGGAARRDDKDPKSAGDRDASEVGAEDLNALSALASSWIAEVSRAVAPLSWDVPKRLVLQAARGTLVVVQAPRALLLVVLDSGTSPDELRLPMGVAIARMERHLRAIEPRSGPELKAETKSETKAEKTAERAAERGRDDSQPPGIFPAHKSKPQGADTVHASGNEVPEVPGE